MDKSLKSPTRSSPRHKLDESAGEKMDVCDASASINGNTPTVDVSKTKVKDSVVLELSDDEDFAGFGVCNNGKEFLQFSFFSLPFSVCNQNFRNVSKLIFFHVRRLSISLAKTITSQFPSHLIVIRATTFRQVAENQRRTNVGHRIWRFRCEIGGENGGDGRTATNQCQADATNPTCGGGNGGQTVSLRHN